MRMLSAHEARRSLIAHIINVCDRSGPVEKRLSLCSKHAPSQKNCIVNEANLIGGENVGGASAEGAPTVAASDDDDGDGDSDPDRRKPRTRSSKTKQQTAPLACNGLPSDGYVRLPQVLAVFPVSKSSWWAGCKSGRYPIPVKLGPRTTAWRVSDIRALIERPAI